VVARCEVDPDQHRMQGRARRGHLPGGDHEPAVGADVEGGVPQRPTRAWRQIGGRGVVCEVKRE
jgi:hypothetical protein